MKSNNFDELLRQKAEQAKITELNPDYIGANKDNEVFLYPHL